LERLVVSINKLEKIKEKKESKQDRKIKTLTLSLQQIRVDYNSLFQGLNSSLPVTKSLS